MKLARFSLMFAAFGILLSSLAPISASALSGADFKAGRIIDDAVFTNKDSMSVAQIQQFLNAKVPTCEINHSAYNASNPPPYTCLKDYQENTATGTNNFGQFTGSTPVSIAGGKSAAQIIWEASQQYNINPQVMIVLLQKEQGLVTDTWPLLSQFTKATGYLCPDTAACNSNAGGFGKQVFGAAWQFRNDLNGIDTPGFFSVYGKGLNNIRLSPNAACGTKSVNVENQATAVLYKYTPYTPNDAALNNLNGLGDGCSAYGNRNFWRYFNDWFGSTLVPSFSAQLVYQSAYPSIKAGQTTTAILSYKNTGSVLWRDDRTAASFGQFPVHLATANETNRQSALGSSWPTRARPALTFSHVYDVVPGGVALAADQTVVNPGQIGEFTFNFTAPTDMSANIYRESFFPVREGTSSWYIGGLAWLDVGIGQTSYSPTFYGQSAYPTVKAGDVVDTYFDVKNSGNTTWYDESSKPVGIAPLRLATYLPINHADKFSATWANPARPGLTFSKVFESNGTTLSANQHVANPGQIVRFNIQFTVPVDTQPGLYREFFSPILEGASNWNVGGAMWQDITVQPTTYSASFVNQSPYPTITKGSSSNAFFAIKNTGNAAWKDSNSATAGIAPVHLATTNTINRLSNFASPSWSGGARPNLNFSKVYESDGTTLAASQHVANPGQIVIFEFMLTVPLSAQPGLYQETFSPILEGSSNWNLGPSMWLNVTVQ